MHVCMFEECVRSYVRTFVCIKSYYGEFQTLLRKFIFYSEMALFRYILNERIRNLHHSELIKHLRSHPYFKV